MKKEIIQFLKPLYAKRDSMHNFAHIIRIKRKVKLFRKPYKKIDENLLDFLSYFHGMTEILSKKEIIGLGFSEKYYNLLLRHTKNPRKIEEKLVSDANLMEAVGKFGIKKCLQVGKERGSTREEAIRYMQKHLPKTKFYTRFGKIEGKKGIKICKDFLKKEGKL